MSKLEASLQPLSLSRPSLHLEIVPVLREMILTGALRQGAPVPEGDLCRRLGVSKTPLREALKVLAFDRWIDLLPNRGAVVARITLEETVELFEVLEGLEFMVGGLAAQRITNKEIELLDALHSELGRHLLSQRERDYFDTSQKTHELIVRSTRNSQLVTIHENLSRRILRARTMANVTAERREASYQEHSEIVATLRSRDAARLSVALQNHTRLTGGAVVAALTGPVANFRC